jgi:hypothetical protein
MLIALILMVVGGVALFYIMTAKAKNKDSNGPMPGK